MYYGEIKDCDIANGVGVRVTLFVSGCTNHCEQCFQPQTWDFEYGKPFDAETEADIIALLDRPFIQGLTLLGGEPFEPINQKVLLPFLERVRVRFGARKDIWAFSGFTFEELTTPGTYPHCEETAALLALCDILVDGRFVASLKNIALKFRGSSNQRILDLKQSLAAGRAIEAKI